MSHDFWNLREAWGRYPSDWHVSSFEPQNQKKPNVVQIRNFTPWSVQPEKMQIIRRIGCAMFVHVSFCGQSWKQNFPNFGLCKATNTKIWPKQNIQYLKFLMKHQALGLTKWTLGTTLPSTGHPARHRNPSKKNKKEHVERVSILVQFPYITVSFR